MSVIEKYLTQYAEPESRAAVQLDCHYSHSLIIPARSETAADLKAVWQKIPSETSVLIIIVINSPDPNSAPERELLETLLQPGEAKSLTSGIYHSKNRDAPDLLIVDRFSPGRTIDKRHGVGLARKIGCDLALQLAESGQVNSEWLHSTDADAILPPDYFDTHQPEAVALLHSFSHRYQRLPESQQLAARLYELSLLYYPAGLIRAGSNYGFPTVGSTISCTVDAYAQVRGFPRRNTGEDFYLLNKLRKIGPVRTLRGEPIELSARLSERVPVGTGQAIAKIARQRDPVQDFQFEHPACFDRLAELLGLLSQTAEHGGREVLTDSLVIRSYVENSGLLAQIKKKSQQHPDPVVMQKFIDDWFDALRTRQFIHHVRDTEVGTLNLRQLAEHFGVEGTDHEQIESLRHQLHKKIYLPTTQ